MMMPTIQQREIPSVQFGSLAEFSGAPDDEAAVKEQLTEHGYCLMRSVLDRDAVMTARREVFVRLESVGEINSSAEEGIATGDSQRRDLYPDANAFWQSVSEGPRLRSVTHGARLRELMALVFGESARAHDMMYLRPTPPGRSTKLHYDFPFFAGRSRRIHTAWIPFGDVPVSDGPLVVMEGSNRFADLIEPFRGHDYESDHSNKVVQKAAYETPNAIHPVTLAEQRETRLLSTDFHAGDLMIFDGFTLHGSLDNISTVGRVRLSCDVRFQPAADPFDDDRYFGSNPQGSNGGSYGDMKAARPMNEPV
jgi:ectoine hydroxylase-related dioxygenase (phytanoyl-CoA dioxygenase family)